MDRLADLKDDIKSLGLRLDGVLRALDDPDSKLNGADAAAIARERRMASTEVVALDPSFDQAEVIRSDYDQLSEALGMSSGGAAATVVRERRLQSALLEQIEAPKVVSLVDELAAKRASAGNHRPPARRRKSG